jgi:hypothetical protein
VVAADRRRRSERTTESSSSRALLGVRPHAVQPCDALLGAQGTGSLLGEQPGLRPLQLVGRRCSPRAAGGERLLVAGERVGDRDGRGRRQG